MRAIGLLAVLLVLSLANGCQRTTSDPQPAAAAAPHARAEAPAASQTTGPDQWKEILGFALELPGPMPGMLRLNPDSAPTFGVSDLPTSHGGDEMDWLRPQVITIQLPPPPIIVPAPEIRLPAVWTFKRPAQDLIDDTRGPLPGD